MKFTSGSCVTYGCVLSLVPNVPNVFLYFLNYIWLTFTSLSPRTENGKDGGKSYKN
jgi:hypothetical protein